MPFLEVGANREFGPAYPNRPERACPIWYLGYEASILWAGPRTL
jgi:hypothetical protein